LLLRAEKAFLVLDARLIHHIPAQLNEPLSKELLEKVVKFFASLNKTFHKLRI
jgi:hypothetical protein